MPETRIKGSPNAPGPNQGKKDPTPPGLTPPPGSTGSPEVCDQKGNVPDGEPKTTKGSEPGTDHKRPQDKHNSEPMKGLKNEDAPDAIEVFHAYVADLKESGEFEFKVTAPKTEFTGLFEGTEIAPETVEKMTSIFEAAVREAAKAHIASIHEKYTSIAEQFVQYNEKTMTESVEAYMDFVVNEWTEQNKLALESSIRTELAESFMEGLRTLFVEHYIDIPQSKVDVVESLNKTVAELTGKLDEQVLANVKLNESIKSKEKALIIENLVAGLNDTDAEKVRSLAEDVEFADATQFGEKVNVLKEAFVQKVPAKKPGSPDRVVTDGLLNEGADVPPVRKPSADPAIAAIARTLGKK